jgi:glycosyltransferase 2 family protein
MTLFCTGKNARLRWFKVLRVVLAAAILFWIFAKLPIAEFKQVLRQSVAYWPWWLAGITLTWVGLWAASLRWYLLIRVQGVGLSVARVFRVFFIGQFFNSFLPGSCGGDVVRAYYVFRESPLKRTEAMSTVVADRGIGLLTLVGFSCLMLVWRLPYLYQDPRAQMAKWLMFALMIGTGLVLIILFRRNVFEQHPLFQRLLAFGAVGIIIRRIYNAFYLYRSQPRTLIWAVVLSLLNMAGLTLACAAFGQSLSLDVSLVDYFTLFPVITVLSAIPITPGALGLREGLFAELFAIIGTGFAAAVSLSLMVYMGGLLWSLLGGLLFLGYSASYGTSMRDEWSKLKAGQHTILQQAAAANPPEKRHDQSCPDRLA